MRTSAPDKVSFTRLFYKLPFWKRFLALCKAHDAKATIVTVCFHWCCLHEWSWIGMLWLKVAYESNVSRSLEFVELIITSGSYKVCDSMRPAISFLSNDASPEILQTAAYLITSVSSPRLLQSSSLYLQTKYIKHHRLFSFSFKHINSRINVVQGTYIHYRETKYYIKHCLFSFSFSLIVMSVKTTHQ